MIIILYKIMTVSNYRKTIKAIIRKAVPIRVDYNMTRNNIYYYGILPSVTYNNQ